MQWKITSSPSRPGLIDAAISNQIPSHWTVKLYPKKFLGGLAVLSDPDSGASNIGLEIATYPFIVIALSFGLYDLVRYFYLIRP